MSEGVHRFPRLSISEAGRLFGLTARALRFYEERGLIEAHRDRHNARYYDPVARQRLEWISLLRRGGVPLEAVTHVLDGDPRTCSRRAVAALEARRRELEAALVEVAALRAGLADADVTLSPHMLAPERSCSRDREAQTASRR